MNLKKDDMLVAMKAHRSVMNTLSDLLMGKPIGTFESIEDAEDYFKKHLAGESDDVDKEEQRFKDWANQQTIREFEKFA